MITNGWAFQENRKKMLRMNYIEWLSSIIIYEMII